jgi:hypothetical protein
LGLGLIEFFNGRISCAIAHHGKESEKSPEGHPVATPQVVACEAGRVDFTAAGGATVAAILHLVRLMGASWSSPGATISRISNRPSVPSSAITSPTADPEARGVGLPHAPHLVEQLLTQIRAQAELKKSLAVGKEKAPETQTAPLMRPVSKLLN